MELIELVVAVGVLYIAGRIFWETMKIAFFVILGLVAVALLSANGVI